MKYDIFISYRRTGGKFIARTLKESLKAKGYNVFLDYDNLVDGHFDSRIIEAIESAPIFMLILSEGCLDRCIMDDDWVRKEIELALKQSKHIIPINPDKEFSGFPSAIPEFIKNGIGQHQFSVLDTDQLYNESLEKIIRERITPIFMGDYSTEFSKCASPKIEDIPKNKDVLIYVDETSVVFVNNEKIGKVKKDKYRKLSLPLDRTVSITLESLEKKVIPIHMDYTATSSSEDIRISFSEHRERISREENNKQLEQKLARESLKSLKSNYERFDSESFNDMTLVYNYGYYGYLNEQGMETIPCIFEGATRFNEGVACVKENGNWRFIDTNGLDVFQRTFDERSYFLGGYAIVCKDGKYGLINKKGEIKIDFLFESLTYPSNNLLLFAKKGDKYFVVDTEGNNVNPIPYDEVMVHQNCEDSWEITSNKSIQIGLDGEAIIKTSLPCFVKQRGLIGRLSNEGKMAIPCFAQSFEYGYNKCIVRAHDKYGFINIPSGHIVLPIKYSFLFPFDFSYRSLYYAALDGRIDNSIPDCYYHFSIFQNTFMEGSYINTETMGVIDEEGHECIPLEYNAVFALSHGFRPIMLGLKNISSDKDLIMAFLHNGKGGIKELMRLKYDVYKNISTKQEYSIDEFYGGIIQNSKKYNFTHLVEETDYTSNDDPYQKSPLTGTINIGNSISKDWHLLDGVDSFDINSIDEVVPFNNCPYRDKRLNELLDISSFAVVKKENKSGLYSVKYNILILPIVFDSIEISLNIHSWDYDMISQIDGNISFQKDNLLEIKASFCRDGISGAFGVILTSDYRVYCQYDKRFTDRKNMELLSI